MLQVEPGSLDLAIVADGRMLFSRATPVSDPAGAEMGGRLMASLGPFRCDQQFVPYPGEGHLRACTWPATCRVEVPADWLGGVYLAKLTIDRGRGQPAGPQSYIVFVVRDGRRADLLVIGRDLAQLEKIDAPFPRITYDEAVQKLQEGHAQGKLENKFEWGGDLGSPDETYLSSLYDRPVMVHRYPAVVKAFYMEPDPVRPELALCVDVLAPEGYGEIIGGGQREDDYEQLKQRIVQHELPLEPFNWYLDLRRYGSVPHAGFGMGIERMTAWCCGIHHIREAIPFPRMLERLEP